MDQGLPGRSVDLRAAPEPEPERPGDLQPALRRTPGRRSEPALPLPEPRRAPAPVLPELGGGGVHRCSGPGQAHGHSQPQAVLVLERRLAVQAVVDQGRAGSVRHWRTAYARTAPDRTRTG